MKTKGLLIGTLFTLAAGCGTSTSQSAPTATATPQPTPAPGGGGPAPAVTASADHPMGLAPLAVTFSATVSGGTAPVALSWTYGDGQTGAGASAQHLYQGPGSYGAVVTATDAAGKQGSATVMITIGSAQKPAVAVGATPASGTAPLQVQFAGSVAGGTAPLTYHWDFGDGSTPDTTSGPTHTYQAARTYTAVITVTDAGQNTSTANVSILVTSAAGGSGGSGGGNTLSVANFGSYFSGPQDPYEPNDTVAWYLGDSGSGNATYTLTDAYIDHRDVTYYADIVNAGPAITTAFYVDFYANSDAEPAPGASGDQFQTVAGMEANSIQRVYFTVTQPTPGVAVTSWIRADSTNLVTPSGTMSDSAGLSVTPTADVDWFAVYETAGQTLTVDLTNLPADYDLELYDPSGTLVAASTNPGTSDEHLSYATAADGNYFVKVYGYQAAYDSGNPYTLNVVVP